MNTELTALVADYRLSRSRLLTFINLRLLKIFNKFDTHYITFPEVDVDLAGGKFRTTITGVIYWRGRSFSFFDTDVNRQTRIEDLDLCDLAAKLSDIEDKAQPLNE